MRRVGRHDGHRKGKDGRAVRPIPERRARLETLDDIRSAATGLGEYFCDLDGREDIDPDVAVAKLDRDIVGDRDRRVGDLVARGQLDHD